MLVHHEIKAPMTVHFELTSGCNHKCIHCYNYWREPGSPTAVMKREDLHRLFENMANCDMQSLVFTGGEPLLCPELLFEAIDLARKAEISYSINSNLALLTDDIAIELKKRNAFILTSFLSCDPDTFDTIVSREGAHGRVVSGIKTALKHGIGIAANMVVMRHNLNHVYNTGSFLKSLGVNIFSATKVAPSMNSKNYDKIKLTKSELESVFEALLVLKEEGMRVDTLTPCPLCFFEDILRFGDSIVHRSCSAGKGMGAIGVDGSVRACPQSDIIYGNAITESLYDIWPRLKAWRDGSMLPPVCQDCELLSRCGGGCRSDSIFHHKQLNGIDPYAVTTNVEKIELPQNTSTAVPLDPNAKICVTPFLRYREESFGVYVKSRWNYQCLQLVTIDSALLLKKLTGVVFCVDDIVRDFGIDKDFANNFFSSLAQAGILQVIDDNTDITGNVPYSEKNILDVETGTDDPKRSYTLGYIPSFACQCQNCDQMEPPKECG